MVDDELCWLVEWLMVNCVGWWNGRWWTVLAGGMVDDELCWLVEWSMICGWHQRSIRSVPSKHGGRSQIFSIFVTFWLSEAGQSHSHAGSDCLSLVYSPVSLTCWIWLFKSGLQPSLTHMLDLIVTYAPDDTALHGPVLLVTDTDFVSAESSHTPQCWSRYCDCQTIWFLMRLLVPGDELLLLTRRQSR